MLLIILVSTTIIAHSPTAPTYIPTFTVYSTPYPCPVQLFIGFDWRATTADEALNYLTQPCICKHILRTFCAT